MATPLLAESDCRVRAAQPLSSSDESRRFKRNGISSNTKRRFSEIFDSAKHETAGPRQSDQRLQGSTGYPHCRNCFRLLQLKLLQVQGLTSFRSVELKWSTRRGSKGPPVLGRIFLLVVKSCKTGAQLTLAENAEEL